MQRLSYTDKRGIRKELRPGMSWAALQIERAVNEQKDNESRERFEDAVCQCCGYEHADARCACDTTFFMDEQGNVECFVHRIKRAGEKRYG